MPKYRIEGDIIRPSVFKVEANSPEEAERKFYDHMWDEMEEGDVSVTLNYDTIQEDEDED